MMYGPIYYESREYYRRYEKLRHGNDVAPNIEKENYLVGLDCFGSVVCLGAILDTLGEDVFYDLIQDYCEYSQSCLFSSITIN